MSTVSITLKNGAIECVSPYTPDFPAAARDLGGKWNGSAWVFDARDEMRVRDLCMDTFGSDGTPVELVTMRVTAANGVFDGIGRDTELYLCGRLVAKVFNRHDQRAKLGAGVVITSGRFMGGGSGRNPCIEYSDGTVFELRDVPAPKAREEQAVNPEMIEIIGSPLSPAAADVQVSPEVQALIDERAALLTRLTEIDASLTANAPAKREIPTYEVADDLRDDN